MKTYTTTPDGINCFYENYKEIESTFPQIEEHITTSISDIPESHYNMYEIEAYFNGVDREASHLKSVADLMLQNITHEENPYPSIPQECIDKLTYIINSIDEEMDKIKFLMDQTRYQYNFYTLAKGWLPD